MFYPIFHCSGTPGFFLFWHDFNYICCVESPFCLPSRTFIFHATTAVTWDFCSFGRTTPSNHLRNEFKNLCIRKKYIYLSSEVLEFSHYNLKISTLIDGFGNCFMISTLFFEYAKCLNALHCLMRKSILSRVVLVVK